MPRLHFCTRSPPSLTPPLSRTLLSRSLRPQITDAFAARLAASFDVDTHTVILDTLATMVDGAVDVFCGCSALVDMMVLGFSSNQHSKKSIGALNTFVTRGSEASRIILASHPGADAVFSVAAISLADSSPALAPEKVIELLAKFCRRCSSEALEYVRPASEASAKKLLLLPPCRCTR